MGNRIKVGMLVEFNGKQYRVLERVKSKKATSQANAWTGYTTVIKKGRMCSYMLDGHAHPVKSNEITPITAPAR